VDRSAGVAELAALAAGPRREHLGEDRKRRLRRALGADVEPARAGDPLEVRLGDAGLAEAISPSRLGAPGAESPDVEGIGCERTLQRRDVELLVMGEHDDRSPRVGLDLAKRVGWPGDDDLVGARQALAGRETGTCIGDDSRPAELFRRGAERLRGVDGPEHEEPRRRREDVGEDAPAVVLEHPAAPTREQLGHLLRELRRPLAEGRAVRPDEQLRPQRFPFDHGEDHGGVAVLDHPLELGKETHSSGSTKTSISPPQGSPTLKASSSAMPYESRRGRPLRSTSCAASQTSLSTHPPETEPAISPRSETTSFEPTGRGADRREATTVATATRSPRWRQR